MQIVCVCSRHSLIVFQPFISFLLFISRPPPTCFSSSFVRWLQYYTVMYNETNNENKFFVKFYPFLYTKNFCYKESINFDPIIKKKMYCQLFKFSTTGIIIKIKGYLLKVLSDDQVKRSGQMAHTFVNRNSRFTSGSHYRGRKHMQYPGCCGLMLFVLTTVLCTYLFGGQTLYTEVEVCV